MNMNFADIIANLRSHDEAPFNGQSPSIYVAAPWAATSDALVEWSGEKGGVPAGRKPLLLYLMTVGEALQFFGEDYDDQIASGEVDAMCAKLSHHVTQRNAQRLRRI
jgi:hypothetical protein